MFEAFTELFATRAVSALALEPVELDPARVTATASRKNETVRLTSMAWSGSKIRRMRLAHVTSPSVIEAWNLLLIPNPELGAPILGAQLLAMSGEAHLAVIDHQALLKRSEAWMRRWLAPVAPVAARFSRWTTPLEALPGWTRTFFSDHLFHMKPVGDRLPLCLEAFDAYLLAFLRAVQDAEPLTSESEISEMVAVHRAYHEDHLEHEPAVRSLGALFGREFTDHYAREFLFDGAREIGALAVE